MASPRSLAVLVLAVLVALPAAHSVLFHHNAAHKHFDPIPQEVQERLARERVSVEQESEALPPLCVEEALAASDKQKAEWREAAKVRLPELGAYDPSISSLLLMSWSEWPASVCAP
jgi:hypothetical protein